MKMGLAIQEIKENSHEGNGEGAGKSLDAGLIPVDESEFRKGDRKSLGLCSSKTFSAKQKYWKRLCTWLLSVPSCSC